MIEDKSVKIILKKIEEVSLKNKKNKNAEKLTKPSRKRAKHPVNSE